MKTTCLHQYWMLLPAALGLAFLCAGMAQVRAQESGTIPAVEGKEQDETAHNRNLTPQYPITYLGFDGTYYYFFTDCCAGDGHFGKLVTASYPDPLGCPPPGGGGTALENGKSLPIPGQMGNGGERPNFYLTNPAQAPVTASLGTPSCAPGLSTFRSRYGASDWLGSTVMIRDQNGSTRYFSLVNFTYVGQRKIKTDTGFRWEPVNYTYPVLLAARNEADRIINHNGKEARVAPVGRVMDGGTLTVPWDQLNVDLVTVEVPSPSDPSVTEPLECLIVNRQ